MIKIQQLLLYIVCIVSWASESFVPQYADEILLQHSLPFHSESQCYNSNKQYTWNIGSHISKSFEPKNAN